MKFTTAVGLLASVPGVLSCGAALPPSMARMRRDIGNNLVRRQSSQKPAETNNFTHWTVAENERQMQVTDDAFNTRDLARFNHHPNSTMYYTGGLVMNLTEHLEDMRITFSVYSDIAPHNHNYRVIFGEGDWTVALAQLTGTNDGPLPGLDGTFLPPTNHRTNTEMMTIARWNGGWMMEEYLWTDAVKMYRQFGVLPDRPDDDLPVLELSPGTPLSVDPAVDNAAGNKQRVAESDDAYNAGNFTTDDLLLSDDALIYGLADYPMNATQYIDWLKSVKTAFPDLKVDNKPYRQVIAQGDWTATVAMLSGTHKGNLTLPAYLSSDPIAPTDKSFDLLHYTIARWLDGKIVAMRVNLDTFGVIASLGISI